MLNLFVYGATVCLCWFATQALDIEESGAATFLFSLPLMVWYLFGYQMGKSDEADNP